MASIINGESSPNYYVTPTGITIGGRTKDYATIADMLADTNPGKYARVADATGDLTVKSGAAIYRREGTDWVKVYEEDSMDLDNAFIWDNINGKPNVTVEAIESAVANAHTHGNYTILSKLGVDTDGNLTIDGKTISGGASDAVISQFETRVTNVENSLTTVNANSAANTNSISTILSSMVKSINGVTPNEEGNVILNTGAGDVSSADFDAYKTEVSGEFSTVKADIVTVQGLAASNSSSVTNIESRLVLVEADKHAHTNISTLDQLSVANGKLQLNGVDVDTHADLSDYATKENVSAAINSIAIPSDISELTDTTNILSGKQNAITGTEGQFVKIGPNGTPVTETIDLNDFGSVKTVNGVSPDADGNVSITVGTDVDLSNYYTKTQTDSEISLAVGTETGLREAAVAGLSNRIDSLANDITVTNGIASSNVATIATIDDRVTVVEGKAHVHNLDGNYYYLNVANVTHPVSAAYTSFKEVSTPLTITDFSNVKASSPGYSFIGSDNQVYVGLNSGSAFSGEFVNFSVGATLTMNNVTDQVVVGKQIAVINNGGLYVRGTSSATTNGNGGAGSLLGDDLKVYADDWKQVGSDTDWTNVTGFINQWLFIKNGRLFTAGYNKYGLLGTAGLVNGEPDYTLNLNTPAEVLLEENGQLVSKNDWIFAGAGCYYSLGVRGSNGKGTIYLWGSNADGTIGDGVMYTHDMAKTYAWYNANPGKYVITGDSVYFEGKTYYNLSGTEFVAIDSSALIGKSIPADTVYEIPYVVRTTAVKPSKGSLAYVDIATRSIVGEVDSLTGDTLVVNGISYTRYTNEDCDPTLIGQIYPKALALEDGTVYNDWEQVSAGYYHIAALRHNNQGESEVYVWGSNEYGNLGNGSYTDESLQGGTLPEGANTKIQLVARPHKLTTEEFPFTDVVKVVACHYGTFISRENGEVYFAGCNKRNYLGTGTYNDVTAFIPKFTKLGGRFNGSDVYCETYGSMVVTKSPRLEETADAVVKATLTGPLAPEKIDEAITMAHGHTVETSMIDATALLINQYGSGIPNAVTRSHSHNNLTDLNLITVQNGVLCIDGDPYIGGSGSGSGGIGITVDPSNKQLDQMTDVAGYSNLAGGFGLEVLSYRKVSDTEAYIHVAPTGAVSNHGRFVPIYDNAGNVIVSVEEQAKGLYGVPSNNTSGKGYIYSSKDLVTMLEKVASANSDSTTLKLYYTDTAHASSPTSGTLALTLTGKVLNGKMPFKWDLETGSIVKAYSEKLDTNMLDGVGVGSYSNEEKDFVSVYTSDGTLLISEDNFKANTYVFEDDTVIENIGSIVIPNGVDGEGNATYHSVYLGSTAGTQVITSAQVKSGIFIKDGTALVKVQSYMIPEKYDESLFSSGSIYIHPGNTNFSGMANQEYTFDTAATAYVRETTAVDGVYPIKSVILKLTKAVTDGDPNSTTEFVPTPGSLNNPMVAAVYSKHRYSTSSVNGEYNSAVGMNASAEGNQNTVLGDFSKATGLCNVVTGDMSYVSGLYNTVSASNSSVNGSFNIVGGTENYVLGSGNITCGSYTFAIGNGNQTMGVYGYAIGSKNTVFSDAIAIGRNTVVNKDAKYSVAIGDRLTVNVKSATILGQNGEVSEFVGNFPGTDTSVLENMASYDTTVYDSKWISNKQGLFICAGSRESSNTVNITPFSFTKYIVRPNNAYFASATGSTNRNSIDPYIYEPFMQYTFTGVMNMQFTDAIADSTDATKFTFTTRDGGRVKTFDPGIELDASSETVDLDFNKATRWKLKNTEDIVVPVPKNFVDGAEAYVIVYAGVTVSWEAFDFGGNDDESIESNHFDGLVWVGDSSPRAVDSFEYGFQLIKLMVVDKTVIAQLMVDTCTNALSNYAMRASAAATTAAEDEGVVEDLTAQAGDINEQIG